MATSIYRNVVLDGLSTYLDAGNYNSYDGASLSWYDLNGVVDGALVNGATFSPTNYGSISFDGVNDIVSIPDNVQMSTTGDYSFSVWVSMYASSVCLIVNKRFNDDYTCPFQLYYDNGPNSFQIFMGGGNPDYVAAGSPNNWDGIFYKWNNICATVNGTLVSLYVNGVLSGTGSFIGTRQVNTYPVRLGGDYDYNGFNYNFNGKISTFMFYNKSLSEHEVRQNYEAIKNRFI